MYFAMGKDDLEENGLLFYGTTLSTLLDNMLDYSYIDPNDHSFVYFKATPIKVKYEAKLSLITERK